MKKLILFIFALFITIPCFSQDIVTLKRGVKIEVTVTEITPTLVRYRLFSEPNGRIYFLYKDDVLDIKYQDGRMESLSQPNENTKNSYANVNQNEQKKSISETPENVTTPKPPNNNENQTVKNDNDNDKQQTTNDYPEYLYQETGPKYVTLDNNSYRLVNSGDFFVEFIEARKRGSGSKSSISYRGIVEFGYQYGLGDNRMDRIKFNFINGIQFNPNFSFGLGVGLRYYYEDNEALIPVFANLRLNFLDKKISPYLSIGVGYSFNATDRFKGVGFLFNPTAGVSINISNKFAVNVGVGYEMQTKNYALHSEDDFIYRNWNAVSLVFGMSF